MPNIRPVKCKNCGNYVNRIDPVADWIPFCEHCSPLARVPVYTFRGVFIGFLIGLIGGPIGAIVEAVIGGIVGFLVSL